MRHRALPLALDPAAREPLVLQIVRALAGAIQEGRLRPGEALPGSRALAEALGVHRNTVLAALWELRAEGWLEGRVGSGTFVAPSPPHRLPKAWGPGLPPPSPPPAAPGFDLPSTQGPAALPAAAPLQVAEGLPDVRLAPTEAMARNYQRALRLHGPELLLHGEPKGNQGLRRALAEHLGEHRGLAVDPEQILVTRGGRMAAGLVASALFRKGGLVAVEDPGKRPAWEALQQAAPVRLRALPVDGGGLSTEALEALLEREPVGLLHLTPRHQFPTTVALAPERRARVMELARKHRFAILEDDYDFEYHYEGAPPLPLAAQDPTGQVIHVGSLSKMLAPGLRLGFLVAPSSLVDRLARVRARLDTQGDRVLEWATADLLRDGDLDRHLRRVRKIYRERRDRLAEGLARTLGPRAAFDVPAGGLAFWLRAAGDLDVEAWARRCQERGLYFHPGRHFSFRGEALPATRLGFAMLDDAQMEDVCARLRAGL